MRERSYLQLPWSYQNHHCELSQETNQEWSSTSAEAFEYCSKTAPTHNTWQLPSLETTKWPGLTLPYCKASAHHHILTCPWCPASVYEYPGPGAESELGWSFHSTRGWRICCSSRSCRLPEAWGDPLRSDGIWPSSGQQELACPTHKKLKVNSHLAKPLGIFILSQSLLGKHAFNSSSYRIAPKRSQHIYKTETFNMYFYAGKLQKDMITN